MQIPNGFASVRVLLVDDDHQHSELRASILKMAGVSVLTAQGPTEALSLAATTGKLDFAIVDYEMPMMNGGVLAQHLKVRFPKLNIILYSAAVEIPPHDLQYVDKFISKDEGAIALLVHLWNVSMKLTGTRRSADAAPQYDNPESPPRVAGR